MRSLWRNTRRGERPPLADESSRGAIAPLVWLPLALSLILVAADLCLTFRALSLAKDIARQAGRSVASGDATPAEAAAWANGMLPVYGRYAVAIHVDDPTPSHVTVRLTGEGAGPGDGLIAMLAPDLGAATYMIRLRPAAGLRPRRPPGRSRPFRPRRNSRRGSSRDTAGDSPRRSRMAAHRRSRS